MLGEGYKYMSVVIRVKAFSRFIGSEFFMSLVEGRFEFLRDKHKLPEDELKKVLSADPTSKDSEKGFHAGKYAEWILGNYLLLSAHDKAMFRLEDWEKVKASLTSYHRAKAGLDPALRDITKAFPVSGRGAFLEMAELGMKIRDSGEDQTASEKVTSGIETVYQGPDWYVGIPHTFEAMEKLGNQTHWCNASSSYGDTYFNRYYKEGISFVIINETDRSERYQFHFASDQYMDPSDTQIDPYDWCLRNPEPTKAMVERVMAKGVHTTGEENVESVITALFVLDLVKGVEYCKSNNIEYMHRLGVFEKRRLVAIGETTNEECSSESMIYHDNGSISVRIGDDGSCLEDLAEEIFKYPEGAKGMITGEGSEWYSSETSWNNFTDEIDKENGSKIKRLAQFIFMGEGMDEAYDVTMDDIDLEKDLGDYDEFSPIVTAIEHAGELAEQYANEAAWSKVVYDKIESYIGAKIEWKNGCWITVTNPNIITTYLRDNDEDATIQDKEFFKYYIYAVVEEEGGKIPDNWSRYENPWEPIDADYLNEELGNRLHDVVSEIGYSDEAFEAKLAAYQSRQQEHQVM
jgi:hypothetical protein